MVSINLELACQRLPAIICIFKCLFTYSFILKSCLMEVLLGKIIQASKVRWALWTSWSEVKNGEDLSPLKMCTPKGCAWKHLSEHNRGNPWSHLQKSSTRFASLISDPISPKSNIVSILPQAIFLRKNKGKVWGWRWGLGALVFWD